MENNIVKAFRQRLKRGGFTDISIYDEYNGKYLVGFRDRNGKYDRREMTELQMQYTPHLVWFDYDTVKCPRPGTVHFSVSSPGEYTILCVLQVDTTWCPS